MLPAKCTGRPAKLALQHFEIPLFANRVCVVQPVVMDMFAFGRNVNSVG